MRPFRPELRGGLRAAEGEADKAGRQAGKRFGGGFAASARSLAAGAAAAFGTAALVGGVRTSIRAASDLSETVNKTNVVFGSNARQVQAWSKTAATSFGLSRQEALAAAAQFGDMFQQLGFTGKAAAATSQSLVKTAADLGSFHNVDPSDVLQRIAAGFRGEYDSLQQLIPNINAARVEQVALAQTGKESAKQLTAQEKATATLAIVQKDGARAAGDFARTSGELANQQRILGAQVKDLAAGVGKALLPVITDVVGFVTGTAIPALRAFGQWFGRNRATILALVAAFAALVAIGQVQAAVLAIQTGAVLRYIAATRVARVAVLAWRGAQILLNLALSLNPIGIVIVALAALAAAIVVAWKRSETFRSVVKASWEGIKSAAQTGVRFVVDRFMSMVSALLSGAARAFGWVPGLGPKLKRAAAEFAVFRNDVNRNLGGIRDKSVTIRARVNDVAATLTRAGVSRAEALNIANRELKGRTYFGGPIRHGVRSKDSALFLARRDEHVWTPEEVDAAGGHAGVFRLRKLALSGALRDALPGFAAGGPVRFDVRPATLTADQLAHAMSPVGRTLDRMTSAVSAAASRGASRIVSRALQAQLTAAAGAGPAPQAGDYSRLVWRGAQFNARTVRMILAAEKLLSGTFRIMQGSFSTRVAASGGTHAGGGVFDSNSDGTSWVSAVRALRRVGFAAWHRSPSQGPWGHHIHAVAIGDRQLSASAAGQVRSLRRGGDGLGGRDRIFDRGGWLAPGWNPPVYNGTGRPEHLTPTEAALPPIIVEFRDERLRDLIDVRFDVRAAEHARRVRVGRR